jgi:hypothetical protein
MVMGMASEVSMDNSKGDNNFPPPKRQMKVGGSEQNCQSLFIALLHRFLTVHIYCCIYYGIFVKSLVITDYVYVKSVGYIVGFEVFTTVVMKAIIFWNITPCSALSFNRRFGGIYRLHLQNRIILLATYFHTGLLLSLFLDPEDGGDMFLRNDG